MKRPAFAWVILVSAMVSFHANAGTIRLRPHFSAALSHGTVTASLTLTNLGTEAAFRVQPAIQLGAHTVSGALIGTLPVDGTFRWDIPLGPPPLPPGTHTLIARISYNDAKGYPISAFCMASLETDPDMSGTSPISVALNSTIIREHATLNATLSSTHDQPLDVTVNVVLPPGQIETSQATQSFTVPARGTTTWSVPIERGACVPESEYVVCAVADTVINGKHVSASARANVATTDLPVILRTFYAHPLVVSIMAALMLVLATMPVMKRPSTSDLATDPTAPPSNDRSWITVLVLTVLFAFMALHLPWKWIFSATMTAGGDTVSHHYLASHLKDTLFHEGRINSWALGWWSGFPAFQYYFCLPYALMALLSYAIPMEIAFKLVTLLGLFLLPYCAWQASRWMKLRDPGPLLLAIGTTILLFDNKHTMWGVNCSSTLAGMISNSLSFPIMLLFLGSAMRDADEGRFRLRTVAFLALMVASHFFTSIIACLVCLAIPLLRPRSGFLRSVVVLATEATMGLLLMAWWLVPLVAKQALTVDFGGNWGIEVWHTLPPVLHYVLPFAGIGAVLAFFKGNLFCRLHVVLTAIAFLLFFFGYTHVAPVFVNNRLWPFVLYGLIALVVAGMAPLIRGCPRPACGMLAMLLLTLCWGTPAGTHVAEWARWNYSGVESKPRWNVYQNLVLDKLKGTPGRLAYDLAPENDALGSSRVFESVPYRIGKPVLEGGIVNSAEGSLFAYIIQGETSTNSAGYPNLVKPATFDFDIATRHLDLFNVKHFIARWSGTRAALAADTRWQKLAREGEWELYELTSNDGHYVVVPKNEPLAVRLDSETDRPWQQAGLDWFYAHASLDQPYLFLNPDQPSPYSWMKACSASEFRSQLTARETGNTVQEAVPVDAAPNPITSEEITSSHIRFVTKAIGEPHLIKVSYFPNWQVRGASTIYRATPNFMVVYPTQSEVELTYGSTQADRIGWALTGLGCMGLLLMCIWAARTSRMPSRAHYEQVNSRS